MRFTLLAAALLVATSVGAAPAPALLNAGLAAYAAHDFVAARTAFRALADDGSAIGETMLGAIYAHGQGVRRDPAAAAAYYFRAARRGYPPAQLAFGRALARGDGVTTDRDGAAMWLRLAEQRGDDRVVAAARRAVAGLALSGTGSVDDDDTADWRPWPGGRD